MNDNSMSLIVPEQSGRGLVAFSRAYQQTKNTPYHTYLMAQTHRSRATVGYTLNGLAKILFEPDSTADSVKWEMVDDVAVLALVEVLRSKKLELRANTCERYLSILKGIMNTCHNLDLIDATTLNRIKSIKGRFGTEETKGRALTDTEINEVIHRLNGDQSLLGVRDKAIIATFLSCGIRRSELATLKLKDLNFANSEFKVNGKGDKVRVVPMPDGLASLLKDWINYYRGHDEGYVFCPIYNTSEEFRRYPNGMVKIFGVRTINDIITKRIKMAGVNHASPHDFRRTFATRRRSITDIKTLQELMGHANMSTTGIYIKDNRLKMAESARQDGVLNGFKV